MLYDVLVIGGGHAGVEAAYIAAKLGAKTILVTQKLKTIAMMPCNPSIGGPAKGVVVREVSALGGIMGEAADKSFLQTKILNTKKGPGVWAIRNQIDKVAYHNEIMKILKSQLSLDLEEGLVNKIIWKKTVPYITVITNKSEFKTKKLIITAGTYTSSKILQGRKKWSSGPNNLETSSSISNFLKMHQIELLRLKTGTPPRIISSSIKFNELKKQPGNNDFWTFGIDKKIAKINVPCYLTSTNNKTHDIIKEYLHTSFLYDPNYNIKGPSRCPSIEDKVMRFPDKKTHQVFIEPDNKDFSISYLQGLSTSLSIKAQDLFLKTVPGLENTKIKEYAYAIEYDAIQPTQLKATLELKKLANIYTAGQINGSSGYEEAAGQGIIAGINAALSILKKKPLIFSRDSSYIGMLIDDLIIKGVTQPYRLLTSMMTYRMYVRSDNAYLRMFDIACKYNLLNEKAKEWIELFFTKKKQLFKAFSTINRQNNPVFFQWLNKRINSEHQDLMKILKNQRITLQDVISELKELQKINLSKQEIEMIDISLKYDGYILREKNMMQKLVQKHSLTLPENLAYAKIPNISAAAIEILNKFRPQTLGQAQQLERVTISDIINIELYIKKRK